MTTAIPLCPPYLDCVPHMNVVDVSGAVDVLVVRSAPAHVGNGGARVEGEGQGVLLAVLREVKHTHEPVGGARRQLSRLGRVETYLQGQEPQSGDV